MAMAMAMAMALSSSRALFVAGISAPLKETPLHCSFVSSPSSPSCAADLRSRVLTVPVRPSSSVINGSGSTICPPNAMEASNFSVSEEVPPISVLFVCWGNICRSPTAEAVFRYAVKKRGLDEYFNIDSAGTISYHEGEPADARMKAAALKRGIKLTSLSRPIRPSDFNEFDLILAMDNKNRVDILKAHNQWSTAQDLPPNSEQKVRMMCEYCRKHEEREVPDPYYGGPAGFEKVLDLLEDACETLLDSLVPSVKS